MDNYTVLFTGALIALGLLLFACMIRAVRGPRIADRLIGINMTGTVVVMMIVILSVMRQEYWLIDVAIVYALLSFLASAVLSKMLMRDGKDENHEH